MQNIPFLYDTTGSFLAQVYMHCAISLQFWLFSSECTTHFARLTGEIKSDCPYRYFISPRQTMRNALDSH